MTETINEMIAYHLRHAKQYEQQAEAARQTLARKINDPDNDIYNLAEWIDSYTQEFTKRVAQARDALRQAENLQDVLAYCEAKS